MPLAHSDTLTGEIYGCNEGSFEWFHEKGHLEYNRNEKTSNLLMIKTIIFDSWLLFASLGLLSKAFAILAIVLITTYFGFSIHEEMWCNAYARRMLKDATSKIYS